MARATENVEIEGLKELKRNLKAEDKIVKQGIKERLKPVGEIVAVEARSRAESLGLRKSGKMIVSIKSRATTSQASVVVSAKKKSQKYPKGYNYAKRNEFDPRRRKAFLYPALAAKKEAAVAEMRKILDEVGREFVK